MARSDIPTLLSLDDFAKVWSLNPLHFNGARLPDLSPEEPYTTNYPYQSQTQRQPGLNHRPIWRQYEWQGGAAISRETLAQEIARAERDIADFMGYWPAPTWIAQEVHKYPRFYRNEYFGVGRDVRWQEKGIKTKYAKVIQAGQRATTLIATATVAGATLVYSDTGLGWNNLATITVPTTLTDECEIKVYFTDKNGIPQWEIRPAKSISISGGFVTITFDSWLLFDPDVVNAVPTNEVEAINASTASNYVQSVEVRREYTDFTATSAQLIWERKPEEVWPYTFSCTSCGGTGCEACSLVSQNACFTIKDAENGFIGPATAASYDSEDARWEGVCPSVCREPDQVKIWYYSGDYSQQWLRGEICDPLDPIMKRMIAILAVSRLKGDFREFGPLADIVEPYRRDMVEAWPDGSSIFAAPEIQTSPFGSRRGEVEVYRSLMKLRDRKLSISAVAA